MLSIAINIGDAALAIDAWERMAKHRFLVPEDSAALEHILRMVQSSDLPAHDRFVMAERVLAVAHTVEMLPSRLVLDMVLDIMAPLSKAERTLGLERLWNGPLGEFHDEELALYFQLSARILNAEYTQVLEFLGPLRGFSSPALFECLVRAQHMRWDASPWSGGAECSAFGLVVRRSRRARSGNHAGVEATLQRWSMLSPGGRPSLTASCVHDGLGSLAEVDKSFSAIRVRTTLAVFDARQPSESVWEDSRASVVSCVLRALSAVDRAKEALSIFERALELRMTLSQPTKQMLVDSFARNGVAVPPLLAELADEF
jgi:hypothetical protein